MSTRIVVDLPDDLAAALRAIAVAAGFEAGQATNLDALLDCLRELEEPVVLVLDGWQELAWRDPKGWARLRALLAHRVDESGSRPQLAFPAVPDFRVERA